MTRKEFLKDLEEEVTIDSIKVGMLAAWCFRDVIIQVSNDPLFKTGVTTVFALRNSIDSNPANNNETDPNNFDDNMGEGDVLIYEGGNTTTVEKSKLKLWSMDFKYS